MDRLRQTTLRVGAVLFGALALAGCAAAHGSALRRAPFPGARLNNLDASAGVVWGIHGEGKHVRSKSVKPLNRQVVYRVDQVQFVDKRHGWISAVLDGEQFLYPSVHPVDPHPWAIERTVDGGRTWRISWLPGCGCAGGELSFYDARHGYVLARTWGGNSRLFWTDDGGVSWRRVARTSIDSVALVFADRRNGFLTTPAGTGNAPPGSPPGTRSYIPPVVYRTTDGGKTWSKYRVAGFELAVHRSTDGGRHWRQYPLRPTKR